MSINREQFPLRKTVCSRHISFQSRVQEFCRQVVNGDFALEHHVQVLVHRFDAQAFH